MSALRAADSGGDACEQVEGELVRGAPGLRREGGRVRDVLEGAGDDHRQATREGASVRYVARTSENDSAVAQMAERLEVAATHATSQRFAFSRHNRTWSEPRKRLSELQFGYMRAYLRLRREEPA